MENRAVILFLARSTGLFLVLAVQMVMSRYLDIDHYAEARKIILLLLGLIPLLAIGIEDGLIYFTRRNPEDRQEIIATSLSIYSWFGLGLAILFYLFRFEVSQIMTCPTLNRFPLPIAFYIFFTFSSGLILKIFISENKFNQASLWILLADTLLNLSAFVGFVWWKDMETTLWLWAMVRIFSWFYLAFYCRNLLKLLPRSLWPFSPNGHWQKLLAFSLPIGFITYIEVFKTEFHKFLMAGQISAALFAIYITGCLRVPFVDTLILVESDVLSIDLPTLRMENNFLAMAELWRKSVERLIVLFFPLGVFLIFVSQDLFVLIYSAKFKESAIVFQIYVVTLFVRFTNSATILKVFGKTQDIFLISIIIFALNILLLYMVISNSNSLFQVAFVTTLMVAINEILLLRRALSFLDVPFAFLFRRWVLKKLFLFLSVGSLTLFFIFSTSSALQPLWRLAISGSVYGILYFLFFQGRRVMTWKNNLHDLMVKQ